MDETINESTVGTVAIDEQETGELGTRRVRKVRSDRGKPRNPASGRDSGGSPTGTDTGAPTGEEKQDEGVALDPKEVTIEAPVKRTRAPKTSQTQRMVSTVLRGLADINKARQPDEWLRQNWTISDDELAPIAEGLAGMLDGLAPAAVRKVEKTLPIVMAAIAGASCLGPRIAAQNSYEAWKKKQQTPKAETVKPPTTEEKTDNQKLSELLASGHMAQEGL